MGLGIHNAGMFGMDGLGDLGDDYVYDDSGNYIDVSSGGDVMSGSGAVPVSSSVGTPYSAPVNYAGIINALAAGAATGTKIYNATQTPSVIPGSNLVWNPATGTFVNASGLLPGVSLNSLGTSLSASGISGTMLLLLGGGLLVVMLMNRGGH